MPQEGSRFHLSATGLHPRGSPSPAASSLFQYLAQVLDKAITWVLARGRLSPGFPPISLEKHPSIGPRVQARASLLCWGYLGKLSYLSVTEQVLEPLSSLNFDLEVLVLVGIVF